MLYSLFFKPQSTYNKANYTNYLHTQLQLHSIHNNNHTMITLLSVLRGFSTCLKWRWNMLENKNKFYCSSLSVTVLPCLLLFFPVCYCSPLPVTVLPCLLLPSAIWISACFSKVKIFTSSLSDDIFSPSGTATVNVYGRKVLCSSPSIVATVKE